jgi:dihydroorotate dehydrogenase
MRCWPRAATPDRRCFLKVAPDLEPADIDAIARIALDKQLGALIVVEHHDLAPAAALAPRRRERAACRARRSGTSRSQRLRDFRQATGGALPLVGVGGIATRRGRLAAHPRRGEPGPALQRDGLRGPGHRPADRARARGADAARRLRSIAEAVGSE